MEESFEEAITTSLVVGVTGHRHLRDEDIDGLQAQVRAFFLDLQRRYPDLPLVLLSPLAEGADRLAAQVALELGLRVIAPLPLPLESYRDDFSAEGFAIFERQLAQSEPLMLPVRHRGDAAVPGPARDRQYAQAGIFVSRHCHILLALWDGGDAAAIGGTAHVVRFHLHGELPGQSAQRRAALSLLGINENTVVRHIPAARQGTGNDRLAPGGWLTAEEDVIVVDELPDTFDRMFRSQAEFNVDSRKYAGTIHAGTIHANTIAAVAGDASPAGSCPIHRLFTAADWLASTYQQRVVRVLRLTYVLAAATGFALILYAHVHSQDAMIYLYLLLFATGVGLAALAKRRQWHRKYLDYRALAEGLRVQSYWRRAGVVDIAHPSSAHDNFMQEQDVELGWIRNAMRAASLEGVLAPVPAATTQNDAVDEVVREWIGDDQVVGEQIGGMQSHGQLRYFTVTAAQRARWHRRAQWLGRACLAVGIAISVLLAIFAHQLDHAAKTSLVVIMGLLSVGAGVHEAYAHKKADKELVKQYRFMQRIYGGARRRLDGCHSVSEKRRILLILGEAALAEHAEWTLMHRERPLEHARLG